jgi:hypothetical protein
LDVVYISAGFARPKLGKRAT